MSALSPDHNYYRHSLYQLRDNDEGREKQLLEAVWECKQPEGSTTLRKLALGEGAGTHGPWLMPDKHGNKQMPFFWNTEELRLFHGCLKRLQTCLMGQVPKQQCALTPCPKVTACPALSSQHFVLN